MRLQTTLANARAAQALEQCRFDAAYCSGAERFWEGGKITRLISQQQSDSASLEALAFLWGYIDAKRGNVRPFSLEPRRDVERLIEAATQEGKSRGDLATELREEARRLKATPEPSEWELRDQAYAQARVSEVSA